MVCQCSSKNYVRNVIGRRVRSSRVVETGRVLRSAAERGLIRIVEMLIGFGAPINTKGRRGETAIALAAEGVHTDLVKLLLDAGADRGDLTELMLAAMFGNMNHVVLALDGGAKKNAQTKYGRRACDFAAYNGHTDIVRLLYSLR